VHDGEGNRQAHVQEAQVSTRSGQGPSTLLWGHGRNASVQERLSSLGQENGCGARLG
jgi:hypothetical protein